MTIQHFRFYFSIDARLVQLNQSRSRNSSPSELTVPVIAWGHAFMMPQHRDQKLFDADGVIVTPDARIRPRSRPASQGFPGPLGLCQWESPPLDPVRPHQPQILPGDLHPRSTGQPSVLSADGVPLGPPVPERHGNELGPHQRFDNGRIMPQTMRELPGRLALVEEALFQIPAMMHHPVHRQG